MTSLTESNFLKVFVNAVLMGTVRLTVFIIKTLTVWLEMRS